MPMAAPTPCSKPGCTKYATKAGRCDDHQREAWESNKGKSRHDRGYGSKWDKLRKRILIRDKHLCQECLRQGIYAPAFAVDHILNKASGGDDSESNLEAICKVCHSKKTAQEGAQAARGVQKV